MISQSDLKDYLYYDPETGSFTWIKKTGLRPFVGRTAGTKNSKGYIVITLKRKLYKAHRLAFFYMTGSWPKDQVDHINHVRDDNRWLNLEEATNQSNQKNRSLDTRNKSGVTGVYWCKKDERWRAQMRVNKIPIYLGNFTDKFEAICARKSANNKHGYHKNHGT